MNTRHREPLPGLPASGTPLDWFDAREAVEALIPKVDVDQAKRALGATPPGAGAPPPAK